MLIFCMLFSSNLETLTSPEVELSLWFDYLAIYYAMTLFLELLPLAFGRNMATISFLVVFDIYYPEGLDFLLLLEVTRVVLVSDLSSEYSFSSSMYWLLIDMILF